MKVMKWSVMALAVAAGTSQMAVASQQSESKGFVEDASLDLLRKRLANSPCVSVSQAARVAVSHAERLPCITS